MRLNRFGIHIKVKDIDSSLEFYQAFGFKEIFAYGSKEFLKNFSKKLPTASEKYNGVTFELNNALIEIADGHIAVKNEVFQEDINSSKISAMIDISSISKFKVTCRKHNINIIVPEKKYTWGTTEIVIKDPDGFVLVFREM